MTGMSLLSGNFTEEPEPSVAKPHCHGPAEEMESDAPGASQKPPTPTEPRGADTPRLGPGRETVTESDD